MQDVQNIPNPDVDNVEYDESGGIHPFTMPDVEPDSRTDKDSQDMGIETPNEDIPMPPDFRQRVPVEEPVEQQDLPPIGDDQNDQRQRLV